MFAYNGKGTSIDNDELSISYLVEDLMLSLGFRNSLVGRTYLRDCLVEVLLVDKHTLEHTPELAMYLLRRTSSLTGVVTISLSERLMSVSS